MKKLFVLLTMTFALSAFSATVEVQSSGKVEWDIQDRGPFNEGLISYYADDNSIGPVNDDADDKEASQILRLSLKFPLGQKNIIAIFENLDESSQEEIKKIALSDLKRTIDGVIPNISVENQEAKLNNVSCKKSGLFKKRLRCEALYTSQMIFTF
jgi:hypothetical protein